MDYSQLSDFEINCEVLSVFKPDVNYMCLSESKEYFYDCGPVGDGWHQIDIPDYCNNAADAWPIIEANGIGLRKQSNGLWCATRIGGEYPKYDKNPLRAAMIVFLQIRDAKHA